MPVPAPVKSLGRDPLIGFLGVNLRRDPLSMAEGDLVRAINADLHTQPGVIRLRKGRTREFQTALADAVRGIAVHNGRRYQLAGTVLYRAQTSILTGLHADLLTTLVPFRPLNDTTTWSFIADRALMRKDDGTNVRTWGIVAPTDTPGFAAGGAGSLTGTYRVRFTYVRLVGTSIAHESNPSPVSAAVTLASQVGSITGMTASTDPQVTHKNIYRVAAGGSTYLFDQRITNATTTATTSQADSGLGTAVETDNNPPPNAAWAVPFQEHMFLTRDPTNPHYLWYSKRFRPESFPTAQFLEIGNPSDPLQSAVAVGGFLGVLSRLTKYRVLGNSVSGFVALEALSSRGTPAPQAVVVTPRGAVFVARDGLFLTTFLQEDTELSQAIQSLWSSETVNNMAPIDFAQSSIMSLAQHKQRLYFGYQDTGGQRLLAVFSQDTQRWYHYQHPCRSLLVDEVADTLLMGGQDGLVWILEASSADDGGNITLEGDLPERAIGERFVKKLFGYGRIDADVPSGTLTADLYVDNTFRVTFRVTGKRTRLLQRLPAATLGYTWQLRNVRYTGQADVRFYGAEMLALPLEAA